MLEQLLETEGDISLLLLRQQKEIENQQKKEQVVEISKEENNFLKEEGQGEDKFHLKREEHFPLILKKEDRNIQSKQIEKFFEIMHKPGQDNIALSTQKAHITLDKSDQKQKKSTKNRYQVEDQAKYLFQCKCGNKFTTEIGFDRHVEKVHVNGSMVMCTKCGMEFNKGNSKQHNHKHHKKSWACDFCEYTSISHSRAVLRHHVNRIHLKIPIEKTHICNICGKAFTLNIKLTRHISGDHNGVRPFKCDVCGKTFTHKKHIDSHKAVHLDVDKYKCKSCGRGFRNNGAFWNHNKLHQRGATELGGAPKHLEVQTSMGISLQCGGCVEEVKLDSPFQVSWF